MDTLYPFWHNVTHYKTKSVHLLGLMNSATEEHKHKHFTGISLPYRATWIRGSRIWDILVLVLAIGANTEALFLSIP